MIVPAKPSSAAPTIVKAMPREMANSAAPAVATAAGYQTSAARGSRRASGAKVIPARAAPAAHTAE